MSTQEPDHFVQPPAPDSLFPSVQGVTNHQTQPRGTIEARDIYAHNVVAGSQYLVHARSDLEELKDYLALAVRDYEARMYAVLGMPSTPDHPYMFLYPFDLKDASIFCGRHLATEELYRKVLSDRLTVLHAKSGAGKTSLLQAGLSPRFIREGRLPLYVHGYEDPILAIKRLVASAQFGPWPKLLHELSFSEFLGLVCDALSRHTQELIIILDQFEQIFLWSQEKTRKPFLKALRDCYTDQQRLRFIISLRKEFYSDLGELNQLLPHHNIFYNECWLKDMMQSETREAIIGPLARLAPSVTYETVLLETLLADLARSEVELPLLQIICTQLYETRDNAGTQITLKSYDALGRAEGVLNHYLNEVLSTLPDYEAKVAKRVLNTLVRSDGMKQMLSDRILAARVEVQKDELDRVLVQLVNARLLRREKGIDEMLYELAHEYLATEIIKWGSTADQAFKQAEELLQRELTNWRIHHDPIPRTRLEMLYPYRGRFKGLDAEAWECLIISALIEDFVIVDWVRTASENGDLVFFQALKAFDTKIRRAYIKALEELGTPCSAEPLITALKDEDAMVQWWAAEALRKLGDPGFEPLIKALKAGDANVRQWAAENLGELEDSRAVEPLIAALKDKNASVQRYATEALGKLGDPRAVEPLIAALKDEDAIVRQWAADALGEVGDPRAIEPLIATLRDKRIGVQHEATEALRKLGDPGFVSLIAALKDEDANVRRYATEALGKSGDPRAIEPLIAALKDEDIMVQWWAAESLEELRDPNAIGPLIAALEDEHTNTKVRQYAAEILGELGDPRAAERLIAALKDENANVRQWAAETLEKLGNLRAGEPLIAVLEDEHVDVRQGVAGALRKLGDPRTVELLIAALKDEDAIARQWAADALGKLGDPRAVEPLIAALKDENIKVRQGATEALRKLAPNHY